MVDKERAERIAALLKKSREEAGKKGAEEPGAAAEKEKVREKDVDVRAIVDRHRTEKPVMPHEAVKTVGTKEVYSRKSGGKGGGGGGEGEEREGSAGEETSEDEEEEDETSSEEEEEEAGGKKAIREEDLEKSTYLPEKLRPGFKFVKRVKKFRGYVFDDPISNVPIGTFDDVRLERDTAAALEKREKEIACKTEQIHDEREKILKKKGGLRAMRRKVAKSRAHVVKLGEYQGLALYFSPSGNAIIWNDRVFQWSVVPPGLDVGGDVEIVHDEDVKPLELLVADGGEEEWVPSRDEAVRLLKYKANLSKLKRMMTEIVDCDDYDDAKRDLCMAVLKEARRGIITATGVKELSRSLTHVEILTNVDAIRTRIYNKIMSRAEGKVGGVTEGGEKLRDMYKAAQKVYGDLNSIYSKEKLGQIETRTEKQKLDIKKALRKMTRKEFYARIDKDLPEGVERDYDPTRQIANEGKMLYQRVMAAGRNGYKSIGKAEESKIMASMKAKPVPLETEDQIRMNRQATFMRSNQLANYDKEEKKYDHLRYIPGSYGCGVF